MKVLNINLNITPSYYIFQFAHMEDLVQIVIHLVKKDSTVISVQNLVDVRLTCVMNILAVRLNRMRRVSCFYEALKTSDVKSNIFFIFFYFENNNYT